MDEQIPLDDEILKLASEETESAEKMSSTRLGRLPTILVRALPHKETPVHDLIFKAIVESFRERDVKVDVVVHGINERRNGLKRGRSLWVMFGRSCPTRTPSASCS